MANAPKRGVFYYIASHVTLSEGFDVTGMVSSLKLLKNKQFQIKTDTYILKASPQLQLWKVILRLIFGLCLSHRYQEWLFWSFSCVFFRRKTIHAIASKYIQHLTWSKLCFFFRPTKYSLKTAAMYFVCSLNQSSKSLPSIFEMSFFWIFYDWVKQEFVKKIIIIIKQINVLSPSFTPVSFKNIF